MRLNNFSVGVILVLGGSMYEVGQKLKYREQRISEYDV